MFELPLFKKHYGILNIHFLDVSTVEYCQVNDVILYTKYIFLNLLKNYFRKICPYSLIYDVLELMPRHLFFQYFFWYLFY